MSEEVLAQPGQPGQSVEAAGRVERRSIDVVPLEERHGNLRSMGAVWFVANINLTAMATGIVCLALGNSLFWTLVAIVVWSFFGTIFMAFHSTQGPHLGLPQLVQSRPQFGYIGAAITVFVFALANYIAYNTSDALLSSDAAHSVLHVPLWLGYVVAAGVAAVIAIFGYDLIHKINRVLTVPVIVLMIFATIAAFATGHITSSMLAPGHFHLAPFMTTLAIVGGFQLGWAPYVSDYSRYLPPSVGTKASFWWTFLPSSLSAIWVFGLGALVGAGTGEADLVPALQKAGNDLFTGGGDIIVVGLLVGLLAVMAINQYGGSLTMLSIASTFKPFTPGRRARVATVLAMAVIVWLISAVVGESNFDSFYASALTYLAYAFTPWTAINLVDFFFVRRGVYAVSDIFKPNGVYGRWGWRGTATYLTTIVVMLPFMVNPGYYTGFIAKKLDSVDYSIGIGLVVAAALYWALTRSLDLSKERELAASDPLYVTHDLREGSEV
ncbi:purine-cytosine permease family protein [Rudaeicoccus suwonensis]|uniref:Purine-cytosine permease-like protein n=1 Tax=Rudaeicoccus suwonensis TaxID=657409 RepID=A0A561E3Z6_9MICO|nr:cytosine permease [Rudaeicoccus suwonensis]TWE10336.1 purine-cytosine permease-like protein [Rudaeicoccus suwonensis]